MDHKSVYLQKHQVPELIDRLICRLVDQMPPDPKAFLADQLASGADAKYPIQDNYPPYKEGTRDVAAAKVLTPEMYAKLSGAKTANAVSVDDVLADGLAYCFEEGTGPEIPGVVLGDSESYERFHDLVDGLLKAKCPKAMRPYQHSTALNKVSGSLPAEESIVLGATVRAVRNVKAFRFSPAMSRAERKALGTLVSEQTKTAFASASSLSGAYRDYTGPGMDGIPPLAKSLDALPRRSTISGKAGALWPIGRGIHVSGDSQFLVLVGSEEEHIEFVAIAPSGNVRDAFERVVEAQSLLGDALKKANKGYAESDTYGFHTANPLKSGSGLTVEVTLKAPKLQDSSDWPAVQSKVGIEAIASGDVLRVRNANAADDNAANILQRMIKATELLVDLEKTLAEGGSIAGKY